MRDISQIKINLAKKIMHIIKQQKLTQIQAAKILQTTQPKVSCLLNNKRSFSIETLFRFLNRLGYSITIQLK